MMLKYISLNIIYRVLNAFILAIGTPLILKQHGVIFFSEFVTISLIIVSLPMLDAGISRKLIRDLNSNQDTKKQLEISSHGFFSLLIIGIFVSLVIGLSLPFLSAITPLPKLQKPFDLIFIFTIFITFLTLFFRPLLETDMRYNSLGLTKLVSNFLIIAGFNFSKNIEGGLVFMCLARLIEAGLLIYIATFRMEFFKLIKVNLLSILKYIFASRYFMLISFLPVALLHSEKFFVETKFPVDSAFLYSISEILLKSTMITAAVSSVLYNFFTKNYFSDEKKMRAIYYTTFFTALSYFAFFLLYVLNEQLVKSFLNLPNYENLEYVLITYWFVSLFTALTTPFVALKISSHYEKEIVKFYAIQLIIMITLFYYVTYFYLFLLIIAVRPIVDSIYLIGLRKKNV